MVTKSLFCLTLFPFGRIQLNIQLHVRVNIHESVHVSLPMHPATGFFQFSRSPHVMIRMFALSHRAQVIRPTP